MARVDPDDDDIRRFVVRRYAYDPLRHERRHQVVAAFDNEREFRRFLDAAIASLARRRNEAGGVDPHEHYSGVELEPGYRGRQDNARLVRKAVEHGAGLDRLIDGLELPANVAILRSSGAT